MGRLATLQAAQLPCTEVDIMRKRSSDTRPPPKPQPAPADKPAVDPDDVLARLQRHLQFLGLTYIAAHLDVMLD